VLGITTPNLEQSPTESKYSLNQEPRIRDALQCVLYNPKRVCRLIRPHAATSQTNTVKNKRECENCFLSSIYFLKAKKVWDFSRNRLKFLLVIFAGEIIHDSFDLMTNLVYIWR
jgi:hypothetical protein